MDDKTEVNEIVAEVEEEKITPPPAPDDEIANWTKSEKEKVLKFFDSPKVKNLDSYLDKLPENLANWTEAEKEEVLSFIKSEGKIKEDGENKRKQEQETDTGGSDNTNSNTPPKHKRWGFRKRD